MPPREPPPPPPPHNPLHPSRPRLRSQYVSLPFLRPSPQNKSPLPPHPPSPPFPANNPPATAPTSFCKCTCFTNSTIIALDARPNNSPPSSRAFLARANGDGEKEDERKEYRAGNCNDCNRQFCLGYNLPICRGADVGDVFTMCFQRDSRKDEAVVIFFIFATAGLLGWAAVKPWVDKCVQRIRERRSYIPVSNQGDAL
ncbi:MAG: hypothetical protein FRX48_03856 [Lasallia pustulata]|uniref:Uncharacterized protein n=1 Tax=Lasallia pustulata TaxID=136370 RepID=A0A5M8PVY8_9LECA|nr:MAG: hypothetical protein FRX48_03856 [Lasallia pustulata]